MAVNRVYYVGDILGYREGENLIMAQLQDCDWSYPCDSVGKPKPFIPIERIDTIEWARFPSTSIIDGPNIEQTVLLDRPFLKVGAAIRRNNMTGIIKEKREVATVKLLNDSAFIRNVPVERLKEISEASSQREILFKGYIGKIEAVTHKVIMTFPSTNVCSIEYEKDNDMYQGCPINPTFSDLKRAKWIGGSLNFTSLRIVQNIAKIAKIEKIEVESLRVNWVYPLPPTMLEDRPAHILTRNAVENVQYLPQKYSIPTTNTTWKMQITEGDLENLVDSLEKLLNVVLIEENNENNEDEENEDGALDKRQKLDFEARQVGSIQPVSVSILQSFVQIEYENGLIEEIPSTDVDEILNRNSVEIPIPEYFVKVDQTDDFIFGLDTNYFQGETERTPMSPLLNSDNVKNIRWFQVSLDDLTDIQEIEGEEVSVYDLQCLRVNMFLEKSDYVTRDFGNDEFTVGSFSKILDNGKIELKDLNGKLFERWPTEISVHDANSIVGFFGKICVNPPRPSTIDFLAAAPYNLAQTPRASVSSTSINNSDQEIILPDYSQSFHTALRNNLTSLFDSGNNPQFERTWVQTYNDRPDFFTGFLLGQRGGILEDLFFLIEIQFPQNYPSSGPVISLKPHSTLSQEYLCAWDEMKKVKFQPWNPNTTILESLQIARDFIERTSLDKMKYGDAWLPIGYFYPKIEITPDEQKAWQQRWNEVICIQSMRYVFNQIAFPEDGLFKNEILGHYRRVLPELTNRWRNWTVEQSDLFSQQSRGFVVAVQNQLRRFDPFFPTANQPGDEESDTESNDELNVENDNNVHERDPNGSEDSSISVLVPPN